jgi:circadian clock protein KaiC
MTLHKTKGANNLKLQKIPTGIKGFDEITEGGLLKNKSTIISGATGCGKTIMSMEFLIRGAMDFNDPGVFMSFEETEEELIDNMESLHFDLNNLIKSNKIYIEHLEIDGTQLIETGKYDLEGLFVRLQNAVGKVGAKRVVIDSLDALFNGIDLKVLRIEITRLFNWFKKKNITAIITAEFNDLSMGNSIEHYIADSVIRLDNRILNQIATRRLRIIKMRGSDHADNEYPFVIDKNGMSVVPLISALDNYKISSNRINSGIKELDDMLDGKGYFEGSSILVSGSAGTGKTSLAVSFVNATCKSKKRCLYCAFEEPAAQIIRNMRSIGQNLDPYIKAGLLMFYGTRPTLQNLELNIIAIRKIIEEFKPEIIVLDPVTNIMSEGINSDIRQMLAHFVDFLKSKNITTLFTAAITLETIKSNPSDEGISAMMDTWILVRDIEKNSERNRGIYVLKSRGMYHSTQVKEFKITNKGINILPTYISPDGILTGSAKLEHSLKEEEQDILRENKIKNDMFEIERRRKIMQERIALLMLNLESEIEALNVTKSEDEVKLKIKKRSMKEITDLRDKIQNSPENTK